VKTNLPPRPFVALSSGESLDVDRLLAEAAADPDFAATLAELTESLKAKLPRDLHDDYSRLYTLKTLVADARSLLAGDLA
jgi:hypothetical protein